MHALVLTFGSLCALGLPRPAKGSTLGLQSWSKGTPFDWTPQIKQKLGKPILFIVNLSESCVFIYIFDMFDLEFPKSCVFIYIFYIFDIWRFFVQFGPEATKKAKSSKSKENQYFL